MWGSCNGASNGAGRVLGRGAVWASIIGFAATFAVGCIYPRRGTSLTPVTSASSGSLDAPGDLWQLTVVGAHIAPRKRGDLPWDDDGGPDAYARVYRGEELIFETPVVDDSLAPEWNATLPRNVRLPSDAPLRFEVWDRDIVGSDPVGQLRTRGLPVNAVPGADARLLLEGNSYLTIRVAAPRAHRGVGIEEYEVRPDALVVARVLTHSPAGRANIAPGDAIVAIGDRRVSSLNDAEAASALSMAAHRATQLTVLTGGRERTIELDRGLVWLSM